MAATPVETTTTSQPLSVVPQAETLEEKFRRLADTWHQAVAHHSSSRIRNGHPAYLEIISLGEPVIPLLLRDMEANMTHWFCALRMITGAHPISPEHAGNIPKMVLDWLQWAKDHGYQW